jgi:hypothetical protein
VRTVLELNYTLVSSLWWDRMHCMSHWMLEHAALWNGSNTGTVVQCSIGIASQPLCNNITSIRQWRYMDLLLNLWRNVLHPGTDHFQHDHLLVQSAAAQQQWRAKYSVYYSFISISLTEHPSSPQSKQ